MKTNEMGGPGEPSKYCSEVGYGKPPKDKRFKKGTSGNPSGRPKQGQISKSLSRVIRDSLLSEVKASVNGKPCRMLRLEAVISKQISNAMQGNAQSARFVVSLAEKHIAAPQSLEELMAGRAVLEFTEEEAARSTKEKLVEGMKFPPEED